MVSPSLHLVLRLPAYYGLIAEVVELRHPTLSSPESGLPDVPELSLFPSAHDPTLDGQVELLCVTLG